MIIPSETSWLRSLVSLQGSVLPRVWKRLVGATVVAVLVTILHHDQQLFKTSLTTVPFTLVGLALSIFLGFRNNTSYDRYWEGRKLWGALVNASRSLCRQVLTLIVDTGQDPDASAGEIRALQRSMIQRLMAFVHALRLHLREQAWSSELRPFLSVSELEALSPERNVPIALVQSLGLSVQKAWRSGWLHAQHVPVLDASLSELTAIQGGCERIKATPLPYCYTALIRRIVAVYCFALPFGIIDSVGLLTPLVVFMVGHAFLGLDAIGSEIENPFGEDENDLPLAALSRLIEINLRQRLGEADLPDALTPLHGLLL
jgi:ion channel-forming bestrophin family protein